MTGLLEGIAGIAGLGSAAKDIRDVLRERLKLEDVLANLSNSNMACPKQAARAKRFSEV